MVDRYTDEEMDTKLSPFIDTEIYKDISKPKDKKTTIKNALKSKLDKVPKSEKYKQETRSKMLDIIDDYWSSQMEYLDQIQRGSVYQAYAERDPIKAYQEEATLQYRDMIDYVRNEMIAYALNPTLKYGEYKVPESDIKEEIPYEEEIEDRGVLR